MLRLASAGQERAGMRWSHEHNIRRGRAPQCRIDPEEQHMKNARVLAKPLTKNEAPRIAANEAKLPGLPRKKVN